jgi:hypothetical protein
VSVFKSDRLEHYMQTPTPTTPESRLDDYVALLEDDYNDLIRARQAIGAVAYLCLEVANKAMCHPAKDSYLSVPAEDMCSLLLCIGGSMSKPHLSVNRLLAQTKE